MGVGDLLELQGAFQGDDIDPFRRLQHCDYQQVVVAGIFQGVVANPEKGQVRPSFRLDQPPLF